jgi:putative DNA primase/helicase
MSATDPTTAETDAQGTVFDLFNVHVELTDMGNCDRFVNVCGDDFRYCALWRKWLYWNGKYWEQDNSEMVVLRAMKFMRYCRAIAGQSSLPKKFADALQDYLYKCESNSKIQSMLILARAKLAVTPEELDTDPWLFNCANGTVDLRTGEIDKAKRGHFITKMSPVSYSPMAECPQWEAFLKEIMLGRNELVEFLQAYLGYSLTGKISEQMFVLAYGLGENGKSVLANTVLHVMGSYASELPIAMIMRKRGDDEKVEGMARFQGIRLAMFSEGEHGQQLAESKLKTLTGGDKINARYLYGESFEFESTCKIFLRTNRRPQIHGTDHAIWRRVNLVPFEFKVAPEKKDKDLFEKMKAESAGILDWLIQGCVIWQKNGMPKSEVIAGQTESYRQTEDPIGEFMALRCVMHEAECGNAKRMYDAYFTFCADEKLKPLGKKNFNQTLEERGFVRKRTEGGYVWPGIDLKGESAEVAPF